ncbi:DUF3789 domain-containing protein [Blautia marasmi]|nr:DUF3789 domain-containing protein [uncultured Blautia sp.]
MAGFIAGMIVGTMAGVSIMCFLQINRAYRKEEEG